MRCFFFGVGPGGGHHVHGPEYSFVPYAVAEQVSHYHSVEQRHLDGTLAPRKTERGGSTFFAGDGKFSRRDDPREYRSYELPQGQYLHHHLSNGFSAVQWWDRVQGDKRGACNSTILLEGKHDAETVLAAGRKHFPKVFENLKAAGIELVEVKCT